MLRIRGLRSGYGALPVLHGIDMDIARGSTAVLLGLNGAGKTTTASNICGVLEAWDGTIELEGTDITSWGVNRCVRRGVVLVPEGRRVFPELTVEKNLQIGAWQQRKDEEWVTEQRERVLGYFPRLRERLEQNAGTLSGGEQQMLAIARGLMARPKLLIIDEASMGLAPVIVSQVFEIIQQINETA
jgi:branched-chain amino acid transport system ATP-binding protein